MVTDTKIRTENIRCYSDSAHHYHTHSDRSELAHVSTLIKHEMKYLQSSLQSDRYGIPSPCLWLSTMHSPGSSAEHTSQALLAFVFPRQKEKAHRKIRRVHRNTLTK